MKDYTDDFYKALGIACKATPKEIRDAYRKAAIQYHPDKTNGDKAATTRFLVIQEGYQVLVDPVQREDYDTRCYPRIQSSPSCASKRAREPSSDADGSAPRRPMHRPKKPRREDEDTDADTDGAWYEAFHFDAAFIESLAERERRFMHDWHENKSWRAHSLMSTVQDIQITKADMEHDVATVKVRNRQRARQQHAGIGSDDGLSKATGSVWPAGFSAHLAALLQSVWRDGHQMASRVTALCSKIIRRQEWPARRGPEATMAEDAQRLEALMPQVLEAWRRTAKAQKRINSELQMAKTTR